MHAIIPVAGIGTRLRPQTWSKPKPLLQVAGKPILAHILDQLVAAGIDHVTLITGYRGDEILSWTVSRYPDLNVDFALQKTADGLASAVNLAAPMTDDAHTLVVLGDTLFTADLSRAVHSNMNMIAVKRVEDPGRFGVVILHGERVTKLVEKPETFISDLAIVGIYGFRSGSALMDATSRLIADGRKTRGEFQLTDAMQLMIEDGDEFGVFEVDDWFDCGKPDTLLETNRTILERTGGSCTGIVTDSTIIPPVHIPEGASVSSSVVGPYVSVGEDCEITGSVISNCVIGQRVILHGIVMNDSIIGDDAEVTGKPAIMSLGSSDKIAFS